MTRMLECAFGSLSVCTAMKTTAFNLQGNVEFALVVFDFTVCYAAKMTDSTATKTTLIATIAHPNQCSSLYFIFTFARFYCQQ